MLALSVIDELVRLDDRGTWTHYMSNQVIIPCYFPDFLISHAWLHTIKVVLYRDTVSVEPVSRPFLLIIGLERHIYGCRSVSRVEKIHFAYTNDTFCVSMGLETISESVSKDTLMCVEHNLDK